MVIIVCVIFIAILLIISLATDVRGNGSCCAGIFVGLSIAFLLFIIIDEKDLSVKPIDVYRGKTTLSFRLYHGKRNNQHLRPMRPIRSREVHHAQD